MKMIKTEAFKQWLEQTDEQNQTSVANHLQVMEYFVKWAKAQHYRDIEQLNYTELLNYVHYEKEKGLKVQTIKLRLNSIKKYYEYLKHIGLLDKNPIKKIKLKGELKTITQNVLSYTELEQLYNDYLAIKPEVKHNLLTPYSNQRYKVILGLLIWQGAISGEIDKMTLEHINLEQGTVYIPKSKRGAGRELKLFNNQILQLYKYIQEARPKLSPKAEELSPGSSRDIVRRLLEQLKGINQKVHNLSQIRASIIIHWIKVYGKRQAQYMAGHKYISSTERFELQEMDSLTDTLLKHHPFS
jgi:site-specific recombinase XerD